MGAFIFLIFFALQTFYSAGFTVYFYANRAYITDKLCVNKAMPEMKCGGKCYLSKKLKEAEQQQSEQSQQLKVWVETAPAIIESVQFNLTNPGILTAYSAYSTDHYFFQPSTPVFHPPSA